MKLGVRAKLFLISLGVITISAVVAYSYLRAELERGLMDRVRADLTIRAELAASIVETRNYRVDDFARWDRLADEIGERAHGRVTIIRGDGTVIGDSQVPLDSLGSLENHANRPEVQQALTGGLGIAERHSTTVDRRMLYVAVPFQTARIGGGVARIALALTEVDAAIERLRNVISIAFVLALVVAVVISSVAAQMASRTARSLTEAARKMAEGDLGTRTRAAGNDEFAELGATLDQLAHSLSTTLDELRAERDRMRSVLTGMQEGLLLVDGERRVALVNPALREMLLLGADVEGKSPLEVIRHAELVRLLDQARDENSATTGEIELEGLKPRRLLVHVVPIDGEAGDLLAVFVDVTHLRRLETLRRDFVANASHELRTPVAAIQSAAETLQAAVKSDPKGAEQFANMIVRNADRLRNLIDDLLDLSRIESHDFKLNLEPLEVSSVVEPVLDFFRERAERKEIILEGDVTPPTVRALADRRALEHVLTNLVDNAVKYCGSGSRVTVRARHEGAAVKLFVSDNGPGIAPEHLPRLFERFYRVDAGRSRELGGTGLGLAIVKHLVEAMGGAVLVESEPGSGTRFVLTLREVET